MYTEEMLESIKKVEASRTSRIGKELRRMDADEKDNLLKEFHPDYKESGFATLKMGPNKGEKAPAELADLLQANSRVLGKDIDLTHPDYDVDVLVIGGGVIPDADIPGLKAAGIAEVFTPGTPTSKIVDFINANVK